jgi:hypothetical protein
MTATIDDALALVVHHFHGVTDKDGEPYVLHCLRVMLGVEAGLAQQVALMHDLIEDTTVTLDDLRAQGFDKRVVEAVGLVTHRTGDSYADYVVRLKGNRLAVQTKLADLCDNCSMLRVLYRTDQLARDLKRIQRYVLSHQFLMDRMDEAAYRERMQGLED